MSQQKLYIGSHAPFWHNGGNIPCRSCHIILAALPAVALGVYHYGLPALGVLAFSISCAMLWECVMSYIVRRPISIDDGNAAVIGLLFGMLLPATAPWWLIVVGTFIAIVIGKEIYGGIGCNPLNPVLMSIAIIILSWKNLLDFNGMLVNYDLGFNMVYPLYAAKKLGVEMAGEYSLLGLFMGQQSGGIGSTFGLGLLIGGLYLIGRGFIRWEISLSFLVGVFITAWIFNLASPETYAGPMFHLLTGYTLIAAFFLITEDSSSPVNFWPMCLYGLGAGLLTVLIRNIGFFVDGVVFAVLIFNIANPLLDKIRPKAVGRSMDYA